MSRLIMSIISVGVLSLLRGDPLSAQEKDGPDFVVKLGGYVQLDGRFYARDQASTADTFVLRRVRPVVQGTVARVFDFYVMPDFGNGTAVLQDAYLDARYVPWLRLRLGKFKTPVDLERLHSGAALTFVERGFPAGVGPNRDLGAQVHGEIAQGVAAYALGIFNGVADGGSGDGDADDGKDVAARVFLQPFRRDKASLLQGLGLGLAGTSGRQHAAAPSFKTPGQQTFFSYVTGVAGAGTRTRLEPQASYQHGPLRLLGQYIRSRNRLARSAAAPVSVTHRAWQGSLSVVVTGESPAAGVVAPKRPFEPGKHGWGALELAARYNLLEVGEEAFRAGLADPSKSARRAQAWAVGLNWYLNRNVKQVVNFERTTFTGGSASGDRPPENAILVRSQISF